MRLLAKRRHDQLAKSRTESADSGFGHTTLSPADFTPARAVPPPELRAPEYLVPPYVYSAPTARLVAERQLVNRALFTISTELKPGWRDAQAAALRCLKVLDDELDARDE
jgi:hypothetical protein